MNFKYVEVPGGILMQGSTKEDIACCVDEWIDNLIDIEYRNQFESWLLKENPKHSIEIDSFESMIYPVTNAEYLRFIQDIPNRWNKLPESIALMEPDDHPVWGVTLDQAQNFATWLSEMTGQKWQLPSESEWEWMARGPNGNTYPFGEKFSSDYCNTIESLKNTTTPVHTFSDSPSWCGVCDLAGNVEEWCDSIYTPYPGGKIVKDDLYNILGPEYPILRGGSFLLGGDLCRGARRHGPHPGKQFRVTGFRLIHRLNT